MKTFLLLSFVFGAGSIGYALPSSRILRAQSLTDVSEILAFDGKEFVGMKSDVLTSRLSQYGSADVNLQDKTVSVSDGKFQYKMSWKMQDFESGLDLRTNQIKYDKRDKSIKLRTSTFNGAGLRSTTLCSGSVKDKEILKVKQVSLGYENQEVFCATATKDTCAKVIEAYDKNENLRTPGVSATKSKAILDEKVKSCMNTLDGYSEVLKAFSAPNNDNPLVQGFQERVVKQDTTEVSVMLEKIEKGRGKQVQSINSLASTGDYQNLADKLTSTMGGIGQIHEFVTLCKDNENNFVADAPAATGPAKIESPAAGRR